MLTAEAAAVGPIEQDGSAFLLLLAAEHDYLFRLGRDAAVDLERAANALNLRQG